MRNIFISLLLLCQPAFSCNKCLRYLENKMYESFIEAHYAESYFAYQHYLAYKDAYEYILEVHPSLD